MTQHSARTKICVNHAIQGKILGRLARYWILYHLGLWCILFAIEFFRHMVFGHLVGTGQTIGEIGTKFVSEHWVMLVLSIVLFPAILWDMLQLTHKVAGPLVRFRNALKQLAAGQPVEHITLRKGDLLTEFQDAFNEFLDSDFVKNNSLKSKVKSDPDGPETELLGYVTRLNSVLQDARS